MNNFIEKPATEKSLSMRGLVQGIGINDAIYITKTRINGNITTCHLFTKWTGMIVRCYSPNNQKRQPSYIGCTVCDEWLSFMNFRSWVIKQKWEGLDLDKDIKYKNKLYDITKL